MDRLRILMVSDFFYPNFGGVENHIYQLSQCILDQGHKVVVMTHSYGSCSGVRYLTNGLKVYYIHRLPFYCQSTFPTIFGSFAMVRAVLLRERITILHVHQAFSNLGLEAALHARTMGYKVVFTDHSLFGFADPFSIFHNKVLKCMLADFHHVICVSHTSKENTVLRACLPPSRVSVIPNAVDASEFEPRGEGQDDERPQRRPGEVTIVALSRLVYRKGIDILGLVIPEICRNHPNVRFVIGGDGPKRKMLEEVIEKHQLQSRVQLAGAIPHENAREFLLQGQVFVNSSLTEAFCMAIVEAASAGLLVVSTRVGGVPEVLPDDMLVLAEPAPDDLVEGIEEALARVPGIQPWEQHQRVKKMYSWPNIADRTVDVYRSALASKRNDTLLGRLGRYLECGPWAGKVFSFIAMMNYLLWLVLEWLQPRVGIEDAVDWPMQKQQQQPQ